MSELTNSRFFVAISIMAVFTIGLMVSPSTAEAASNFKVNADLTGVSGTNDEFIVTVTTSFKGYPTLERTKVISTNHQICPDDIDSACYSPAGLFSFPSGKVAYKTNLKICAENEDTGDENCNFFQKKNKWPPTLKVTVPGYYD